MPRCVPGMSKIKKLIGFRAKIAWVIYRANELNKKLKQCSDKYVIVNEFDLSSYWDIGSKNKLIVYA